MDKGRSESKIQELGKTKEGRNTSRGGCAADVEKNATSHVARGGEGKLRGNFFSLPKGTSYSAVQR